MNQTVKSFLPFNFKTSSRTASLMTSTTTATKQEGEAKVLSADPTYALTGISGATQ
jgi:hypothetical protein